jgi:uncharacterized protein (TIGR02598 family)
MIEDSPTPLPALQRPSAAGFSLIEVSLALAVVGVGFVSTLGLMGSGLSQYRSSMDATMTAQIAQRVINDAQQADFSSLVDIKALADVAPDPNFSFRAPLINAPGFRYFDAQGTEIFADDQAGLSPEELAKTVYQVNVRIRPFGDIPRPSLSKQPHLAQLTVQVVHLHGPVLREVEKAEGPKQNLFQAQAGIPVYTYAALVGRNE